jgi:hypothetical protein
MEKDDFLTDDFLGDLIRRAPLDSPSDDFVDRVMANIQASQEVSVVKKPFYLFIKAAIPYASVALIVFVIIGTSDIPLFNWLPGKSYFTNDLIPYFGNLFADMKNAFASKYVSWVLLISFSTGFLFSIDRFFSHRTSV